RPFKVRRLTHFGFNCGKLEDSIRFYTELLGFVRSDKGMRGTFLRCSGDHHSFVLFPDSRKSPDDEVTINQITWQVQSLNEVIDGARWIAGQGIRTRMPLGRAPG